MSCIAAHRNPYACCEAFQLPPLLPVQPAPPRSRSRSRSRSFRLHSCPLPFPGESRPPLPPLTSRASVRRILTSLYPRKAPAPAKTSNNGNNSGNNGRHNGNNNGNNHNHNHNNNDQDPNRSPLSLYLHLLNTRPLPTKSLTSAVLSFLSDLLAQTFEPPSPYNLPRLLSLFLVGLLLTAPMFHYLYYYLELFLPVKSSPINLVAQLAIDQLIAAPIWLALFFVATTALDNRCRHLSLQLKRDFIPAVKLTWTVFPPLQLLSFALLPPVWRVMVLNVADLFYTAVLSYLKHRPLKADQVS